MSAAPGTTQPSLDREPRRHMEWRDRLGIIVSIVAIAGVVWWASKQSTPEFPTSTGAWLLLLAALVLYSVATLARGWRWHVILRLDGIAHERADAYGLVAVGYMGNTVLPARGGEVLRILLLGDRTDARRREILGSIIAERLLDVIVLVGLFGVLTIIGVADRPAGATPAVAAAGAAALGFVGLGVYLALRRRGRFEGFADKARPIARQTKLLLSPTGALLTFVTAVVWMMEGVIFMLIARSLDVHISLIEGTFLTVLASFFALIPAAPGYVGTFDAAILFGANALGITGGTAVTFAVLVRFLLFVPITIAGLILVLTRYGGVGTLRAKFRNQRSAEGEPVPAEAELPLPMGP